MSPITKFATVMTHCAYVRTDADDGPTVVLLTFCANVLIEWMEGREGGKKGGHTGTGKVVGSREVEPPAGCKRLRR